MRKFISLLINTTRDIIRQPLVALLMVICVVTIGVLPVLAVFSLGQEERIVSDGAIASCFMYGLFLVVASSVASISKQVRSGTAGNVLSKPVSREMFFISTYCGIVVICLVFVAIGFLASELAVRMALRGILTDWLVGTIFAAAILLAFAVAGISNYRGHNFFSSLIMWLFIWLAAAVCVCAFIGPEGNPVKFGAYMQWRLLPVSLLLFGALAMLAAIAVTLSTRFSPVIVLAVCCLVFVLGLIADYLLIAVFHGNMIGNLCAALLPNWQVMLVIEGYDGNVALTGGYILMAGCYAALYIAGFLCLGILSFKNTEA